MSNWIAKGKKETFVWPAQSSAVQWAKAAIEQELFFLGPIPFAIGEGMISAAATGRSKRTKGKNP